MPIIRISDAEWDVMNVVWAQAPISADDVADRLAVKGRHPKTVKTLLNRLLTKGVVSYVREGKRYLYQARADRETCVRQESRSFLERVFNGAELPMLVRLVQEADLTPQEIEQLRQTLTEKQ